MKVKDLFEKDINYIKVFYEEHYKEKQYNTPNDALEFFKVILRRNTENLYSVSLNENYYDYQETFYFFFVKEDSKDIYLLKIYGCSCGWDYSVENDWESFFKNVLNEELIVLIDELSYKLKQKNKEMED